MSFILRFFSITPKFLIQCNVKFITFCSCRNVFWV